MTTPPNWPVGYPCIVVTNFPGGSGFLPVAAHTEAKVIQARATNGENQACIELPSIGGVSGATGWVPHRFLRISQQCKVGDIGFNIGRPPNPSFSASALYQTQGGLLYTAIKNLLLSYHHIRRELPIEPVYVRDRLDSQARQGYFAERIIKGMNRVNRNIKILLDTGDFSMEEVANLCPSARESKEVGIYFIVHAKFSDPNRMREMYTGSTSESFKARGSKHGGSEGWNARAPTSPHYRAAKQATSHVYSPICYFDSDDTEKSDLKIAEQVFQDLFQTTCGAVLNLQSFSETNEDTDASVAEARRALRAPEAQARASKYLEDKEAATLLAKNADNVFAVTGWPGGVRRRSGLKAFGVGAGLNWSQPITEMQFEKQTWIKTSIPGQFANFRRVAFISKEDTKRLKGSKLIWQKNTTGKGDSNVAFYLPQNEPGPGHGAKVHVVVEVRLDNQRCGVPWARAPDVGHWSDSADATKVAMRIEWEDANGKWWFKHLQTDYPNNFAHENDNKKGNIIIGATTGYRVATGLKAYFLRQHRPQTQDFPWIYDFGIAEVKEVYFDWLSQKICSRRVTDTSNASPIRALKEPEIAKLLLDAGAERYAHRADQNAAETFKGDTNWIIQASAVGLTKCNNRGPSRQTCDYCSAMVKAAGRASRTMDCQQVGSTRRCTQCHDLGRPCTFTRESRLLDPNNTALLDATIYPKKANTAVQPLQIARFILNF